MKPTATPLAGLAWSRWQFGDWEHLAHDVRPEQPDHSESATEAMLRANALLQLGETDAARMLIARVLSQDCDKALLLRLLLSGAYNSVARLHALLGSVDKSSQYFSAALELVPIATDCTLAAHARANHERTRLGLPAIDATDGERPPQLMSQAWIERGLEIDPVSAPLLIAAAEQAQRLGDLTGAIRYWQRLAAVDDAHMAPAHYERLQEAYRQLKQFPAGEPAEEAVRGDVDKLRVLKHIHQRLQPRQYLEIGVQHGRSLALATCPAVGVDPMPMLSVALPHTAQVIRNTSDAFFADQASQVVDRDRLDLVFIDGMHLFEYALWDFIHAERFAGPQTLVVIDDILPCHSAQAARDRRTRAWTGDVWKLLPTLQQHRPDLTLHLFDTHPTGILCVSGFGKDGRKPADGYKEMVESWGHNEPPPAAILERVGALPSLGAEMNNLLDSLLAARDGHQH